MKTLKEMVMDTPLWCLFAIIFLACAAIEGCSSTNHCCPQCRANANDCNLLNEDLKILEHEVRDMKRGYRTVPVTVCITNAWDEKAN